MLSMRTNDIKRIQHQTNQLLPKMGIGVFQVLGNRNLMGRVLSANTYLERMETVFPSIS